MGLLGNLTSLKTLFLWDRQSVFSTTDRSEPLPGRQSICWSCVYLYAYINMHVHVCAGPVCWKGAWPMQSLWCVHVEEHSSLCWMWTLCGWVLPFVGVPSFWVSLKCRPSSTEVIAQACMALTDFFRSSYFKAQIQVTFVRIASHNTSEFLY